MSRTSHLRCALVVDDEDSLRHLLVLSLEGQGIEVDCASDGVEALERYNPDRHDVVLTDIRMPRLDGLGFTRRLLEDHQDAVVVVMSAYGDIEVAMQALEAGAVDIILKPKMGVADHLVEAHHRICETVKGAAQARLGARRAGKATEPARKLTADAVLPPPTGKAMSRTTEMVVCIGASTGGTEALREVLEALPGADAGRGGGGDGGPPGLGDKFAESSGVGAGRDERSRGRRGFTS